MKTRTTKAILSAASIVLLVLAAGAQEFPKAEVGVDYSYARYSPSHAFIPNSYSLNGGGGFFTYNFTRHIGFKADFLGYGSNSQAFSIPAGTGPCPPNEGNQPCTGNAQANLFTYLFGPQVGIRTGRFRPYAHVLFGGAHSNAAANLYKAVGNTTLRPSNNAFALAFGGGIDIGLNHSGSIAFRPVEVDYLWTRFNISTGQSSQSNFQYKTGVVFNFGGGK